MPFLSCAPVPELSLSLSFVPRISSPSSSPSSSSASSTLERASASADISFNFSFRILTAFRFVARSVCRACFRDGIFMPGIVRSSCRRRVRAYSMFWFGRFCSLVFSCQFSISILREDRIDLLPQLLSGDKVIAGVT